MNSDGEIDRLLCGYLLVRSDEYASLMIAASIALQEDKRSERAGDIEKAGKFEQASEKIMERLRNRIFRKTGCGRPSPCRILALRPLQRQASETERLKHAQKRAGEW